MPENDPDNLRPQGPRGGGNNGNRSRMSRGVLSWVVFIALALLFATLVSAQFPQQSEMNISDFRQYATAKPDELDKNGKVISQKRHSPFKSLTILDNRITGEYSEYAQGLPRAPKGQFFVKYPPGNDREQLIAFLTTNNP